MKNIIGYSVGGPVLHVVQSKTSCFLSLFRLNVLMFDMSQLIF